MFIRRKKNRSGSFSVQIIRKVGRINKVVKSIGVGHTERELELLENIAHFEKDKLMGLSSLFHESDDVVIDAFVSTLYNEDITLQGPDLVFGALFDQVGYSQILRGNSYLKALVVSRLVMPGSKLKTVEYLKRHSKIDVSVYSIYKFLDKLDQKMVAMIQQITFKHTKKVLNGKIGLVFYDMTTLYFEAEQEDDLRKIGYSKDGKHQHPQIMIGLLVSSNGYPIAYQIFEGNTAETKTLIPAIQNICQQYKIAKPIVIADAALLSNKNIVALENNEFKYILGGRVKSEQESLRQQILNASITETTPCEFETERGRLVVSFSIKRQKKDAFNRKRGLTKLEKKVATGKLTKESINNRGYNKYLKLEGNTTVKIDYNKYRMDQQWDGLKGYNTNTKLSPDEVIEIYSNLWVVEKAFRISKTDLKVRPIYHRKKKRIEAHICICFMAYTLYKELERRLKVAKVDVSIETAINEIKDIMQITYTLPKSNVMKSKLLKLTNSKSQILKLI
jgi:transposase